jgi:hypothetical protein
METINKTELVLAFYIHKYLIFNFKRNLLFVKNEFQTASIFCFEILDVALVKILHKDI